MSQWNSILMGAHFRPQSAKDLVLAAEIGTKFEVKRDASNQYHDNAIALFLEDEHVGFFERGLADELAPLMDESGAEFVATLSGFMENPLKPFLDIDIIPIEGVDA